MKKFNKYTPEARETFTKVRKKYKKIVSLTGHRPDKLLGYGIEPHRKLTSFLIEFLKFMDCDLLVHGAALGMDLAGAEAALALKIPILTALPFKSMGSNWWDKTLLNRVKKESAYVVDVCGDPFQNWKYMERNSYMVDLSDEVMALYNETPGGTQNCVHYAIESGRPIINLWNDFEKAFPSPSKQ